MYSVEGKLVVRQDPEIFLGRHGLFFETVNNYVGADFREHTDTNVVWVIGSQAKVDSVGNRMRKKGRIPADLKTEKITSIE